MFIYATCNVLCIACCVDIYYIQCILHCLLCLYIIHAMCFTLLAVFIYIYITCNAFSALYMVSIRYIGVIFISEFTGLTWSCVYVVLDEARL